MKLQCHFLSLITIYLLSVFSLYILYLLPTSMKLFGSNKPEFGRTQYRFGAVVLILNRIDLSVGFFNSICDVIA